MVATGRNGWLWRTKRNKPGLFRYGNLQAGEYTCYICYTCCTNLEIPVPVRVNDGLQVREWTLAMFLFDTGFRFPSVPMILSAFSPGHPALLSMWNADRLSHNVIHIHFGSHGTG